MSDNATKTDLLSLQDRLNKLDAMADDPWKHKAVEWDEAYADAQYEARACKGMAMGAQAHDIAERFKRAGKRFHACAALDLVPVEKTPTVAKYASFGPGDPFPDPPPTKVAFTAEEVYFALNDGVGAVVLGFVDGPTYAAHAERLNAMIAAKLAAAISPSPPTKPLMPQTGEELWGMLRISYPGEYAVWGEIGASTAEIMERLVVILNGKPA